MSIKTDSQGRRSRTRPQSTGKHITLQPADLIWFEKIHQHGPLPSSFLLQYTANQRKSEKRASERLTDLFNEDQTKHGGCYLDRPLQQFRTIDSRYNQLVYDLLPAAELALKEQGLLHKTNTKSSGPWLHQFMVACVTASIELATLQSPSIRFIPQYEILERANTTLRYPIEMRDPNSGKSVSKDLIPDALFGLEYKTTNGSRYRFFMVECDRSTEPATSKNFNRKSLERNLQQYRKYIVTGRYKEHLKLTAPLLVLNITTSPERLTKMIEITNKLADGTGNSYQLFQSWSDFGPVFRPPSPNLELLNGLWQRAGQSDFVISKA